MKMQSRKWQSKAPNTGYLAQCALTKPLSPVRTSGQANTKDASRLHRERGAGPWTLQEHQERRASRMLRDRKPLGSSLQSKKGFKNYAHKTAAFLKWKFYDT
jgi:hypothetical protein